MCFREIKAEQLKANENNLKRENKDFTSQDFTNFTTYILSSAHEMFRFLTLHPFFFSKIKP